MKNALSFCGVMVLSFALSVLIWSAVGDVYNPPAPVSSVSYSSWAAWASNALWAANATNANYTPQAGHATNTDWAANATNATSAVRAQGATNVLGGGTIAASTWSGTQTAAGNTLTGVGTMDTTNATVSGVTTSGTMVVTGNASFGGPTMVQSTSRLILFPVSLDVTNNQVLTVAASAYVVYGMGSALDTTNTLTLNAPAYAGQVVAFMGGFMATNCVTFPSSGASRIPTGLRLDDDDACVFMALDTSTWLCISYIDNQ